MIFWETLCGIRSVGRGMQLFRRMILQGNSWKLEFLNMLKAKSVIGDGETISCCAGTDTNGANTFAQTLDGTGTSQVALDVSFG